jgi:hypothetical protein
VSKQRRRRSSLGAWDPRPLEYREWVEAEAARSYPDQDLIWRQHEQHARLNYRRTSGSPSCATSGARREQHPVKLSRAHRGPLTWWIFEPTDTLMVTCSRGHRSWVRHHVLTDGTLRAPDGCLASMHCGICDEDLPLSLADWPQGETWAGPRPEKLPPETECVRCHRRERFLGGWGICGQYVGLICKECFDLVVRGHETKRVL